MSEHPSERTTLLAKHRNYGNCRSDSDDEGSSLTSDENYEYHNDYQLSCGRISLYLVEPMVFLLLFGYNLSSTIMKNQIIYQTCSAIFAYNESDCKSLGTHNATDHTKEIETAVEPYAASIFMTITIIQSVIPSICGSFIGTWSDRFGRKPLLVTAFAGYAIFYSISTGIAYLASVAVVSPWYYLLAVIPHALLGGNVTYAIATFCYITDVSSERERAYRMAFYEAAIYIGLMVGSLASGFIYEASDSTTVFAISAGTILFAVCIIVLFVPESLNMREQRLPATLTTPTPSPNAAATTTCANFFDWHLLRDMWTVCFKPREYNDRSIVWLAISALLVAAFALDGTLNVFYLFIREKFHWSVKQFTIYETLEIFVPVVGNLCGMWLLRKMLRISLVHLAIGAFISASMSCVIKGFAIDRWQLYVAIAVSALKSLGNPMCRTIIANIVPANELGKVLSFYSVLHCLMPFLATPIYTLIYSVTLTTFPGFFNVVSAHLYIVAITLLCVILRKKRICATYYDSLLN